MQIVLLREVACARVEWPELEVTAEAPVRECDNRRGFASTLQPRPPAAMRVSKTCCFLYKWKAHSHEEPSLARRVSVSRSEAFNSRIRSSSAWESHCVNMPPG